MTDKVRTQEQVELGQAARMIQALAQGASPRLCSCKLSGYGRSSLAQIKSQGTFKKRVESLIELIENQPAAICTETRYGSHMQALGVFIKQAQIDFKGRDLRDMALQMLRSSDARADSQHEVKLGIERLCVLLAKQLLVKAGGCACSVGDAEWQRDEEVEPIVDTLDDLPAHDEAMAHDGYRLDRLLDSRHGGCRGCDLGENIRGGYLLGKQTDAQQRRLAAITEIVNKYDNIFCSIDGVKFFGDYSHFTWRWEFHWKDSGRLGFFVRNLHDVNLSTRAREAIDSIDTLGGDRYDFMVLFMLARQLIIDGGGCEHDRNSRIKFLRNRQLRIFQGMTYVLGGAHESWRGCGVYEDEEDTYLRKLTPDEKEEQQEMIRILADGGCTWSMAFGHKNVRAFDAFDEQQESTEAQAEVEQQEESKMENKTENQKVDEPVDPAYETRPVDAYAPTEAEIKAARNNKGLLPDVCAEYKQSRDCFHCVNGGGVHEGRCIICHRKTPVHGLDGQGQCMDCPALGRQRKEVRSMTIHTSNTTRHGIKEAYERTRQMEMDHFVEAWLDKFGTQPATIGALYELPKEFALPEAADKYRKRSLAKLLGESVWGLYNARGRQFTIVKLASTQTAVFQLEEVVAAP